MRILTGKHRREYEKLLEVSTRHQTQALLLHDRLDECREQMDKLHADLAYERDRANQAVDALLVSKGHPPVTPPRPDPTDWDALFEEDAEELKALKARIDAGQPVMGAAAGQRE